MSDIKDDKDFSAACNAYWQKRGYSDLEKVRAVLESYVPQAVEKAVAAERERCAKLCEDYSRAEQQSKRTGPLADPYNISSDAKAFAAANIAGFIRSTAQ